MMCGTRSYFHVRESHFPYVGLDRFQIGSIHLPSRKVVEAQDDLKPLELSYVARKSSYDAQMRALVLASL